jgi:hypothetical protein
VFHATKRERHTNNWTSSTTTTKNTYLSQEFNKAETSCTAGAGWIDCWRKCYVMEICPEKLSADLAWLAEFSALLQAVMKN